MESNWQRAEGALNPYIFPTFPFNCYQSGKTELSEIMNEIYKY